MRSALCSVLVCGVAISAAAQERVVTFEEPPPVTVTGFAVGRADYGRVARANTFTAGKIGLSLFKPVGSAYLFAQLTTALDGGVASTDIDNLLVSWTPQHANRWALAFGRFDAPIGFERDDEPLNLIATNSFNFTYARPSKLTGVQVHYTASPRPRRALRPDGRQRRTPDWDVANPALRDGGPDVVLLERQRGHLQQYRAHAVPPAADRPARRRPRRLVVTAVLHGCVRGAAGLRHEGRTRARVHLLGGGAPCCTTCDARTPASSGSSRVCLRPSACPTCSGP